MNKVALKVKTAFENCLTQMKQVEKKDPEWLKAIEEGERALEDLSKSMEQQYYTVKQLDAALEIANVASMNGYRSIGGRDVQSQFLNWAVEFERNDYDLANRINEMRKFSEQKMLAEVESGQSRFRDGKMTTWIVDRVGKESKLKFDPTTPENYLQVLQDDTLKLKHQYDINDAFEERILQVGDRLEEKGWKGYSNFLVCENPLSMNDESKQIGVYFKPVRMEDTGNVIGGTWVVSQRDENSKIWQTVDVSLDGLSRTSEFVADKIMAIRNKLLYRVSGDHAVTLAKANSNHVDVADLTFIKTVTGAILGRTGMHIVQSNAKENSAVIYKISDLSRVPEEAETVNISFRNGKGMVSKKETARKGNER